MIKINLAPPPARRARFGLPGPGLGLLFGTLFVVEVVAMGLYFWVLAADASRFSAEIAESQRELDRLKPIIAEGQRHKQEKEDLERRVFAIETVLRNQARPAYLMDTLAGVIPPNLWLTGLEEKGQLLRVTGTTYSSVALSDFMANLKASRRFLDVDLIESRQDLTKSPRLINFVVTCRFDV